jgi:hypothetical protein
LRRAANLTRYDSARDEAGTVDMGWKLLLYCFAYFIGIGALISGRVIARD